jgi:hypothetical protein
VHISVERRRGRQAWSMPGDWIDHQAVGQHAEKVDAIEIEALADSLERAP